MASNGLREEKPLPRIEVLAALIIFLLPFLLALFRLLPAIGVSLPGWLDSVMLILFLGAVLLPLGMAIIKGIPRWSLSYLGLLLMLGIVLTGYDRIWRWIYPIFTELFGPRSLWSIPIRTVYVAVFEFIFLFSILMGGLILVNLLRLLPHTSGVWQRIRTDWTQLSFLLYGGLVFSIVLVFDEYRYNEAWQCAAWACLALGAWLYLRARGQKRRILALICGATGAMWIVALGKWVLIPLQKWPVGYPVSPSEVTRWVETGSTMIGSIVVLMMLLAPALLKLLPRAPGPVVPSDRKPVTA